MWVALADLMDDEFFGLDRHGLRRGSYALMTRAAVSSHNLEHALRRIFRFLRSTLDDFRGELIRTESEARVILHDGGVLRRLFGYGTWFILVHGLACWLVHRRIPLSEMQFRCAPPADDSHYRTRFCDNVSFNAKTTHIVLASDLLDLKIAETPETVDSFLRAAPANLLVQYRNDASTSAQIRKSLRSWKSPTLFGLTHDRYRNVAASWPGCSEAHLLAAVGALRELPHGASALREDEAVRAAISVGTAEGTELVAMLVDEYDKQLRLV